VDYLGDLAPAAPMDPTMTRQDRRRSIIANVSSYLRKFVVNFVVKAFSYE
jgi:hypothetical protein